MVLFPQRAQANDYLEHPEHFTVMSMGQGVLRFYVPVWVYGAYNDYYVNCSDGANDNSDSYIWYSDANNADRGGGNVHRAISVRGIRYGRNDGDNPDGEGEILVHEGNIVVLSTYNGQKVPVNADNQWHHLSLKRRSHDDHKRITYFEFDWYPPAGLDNQDFYAGISVADYKKSSGKQYDLYWWRWAEKFTGSSMPQSPQLMTPYLYVSDLNGSNQVGYAGIQYVAYQEPINYTTSFDPTSVVTVSDRAGTIVVPMQDSVQPSFQAQFLVWSDKGAGAQRSLYTNSINIPAYHKPYDLSASEVVDEKECPTGDVEVKWSIHTPRAEDILSNDVFEVQRALKSDFSDAQSIQSVSFSPDSASYTVSDNVVQVLANDTSYKQMLNPLSATQEFYVEKEGKKMARYTATMRSNSVSVPGKEVFYRVRRASSSIWGWNHGYAQTTSLVKHDYLAPLIATQPDYTLDADFETNRKVYFRFNLDTTRTAQALESKEQCVFETTLQESLVETMPFTFTLHPDKYQSVIQVTVIVFAPSGERSFEKQYELSATATNISLDLPTGSTVVLRMGYLQMGMPKVDEQKIDRLDAPVDFQMHISSGTFGLISNVSYSMNKQSSGAYMDSIRAAMQPSAAQLQQVKDSLYSTIEKHFTTLNGVRPSWDKNARLFLRRTYTETGETVEIPVPQDSIKRDENGMWYATMSDVAAHSCVHYQYAVRIDQSASPRKVADTTALHPVVIHGPELYRNDAGQITAFNATQGTDRKSILLTWETLGSMDEYTLYRKDSTTFDSLLTTTDSHYRDESVTPGKTYEYKLVGRYTCNGTTTERTQTTSGYRSPYGIISGRILQTDGTGVAGVEVALESDSTTLRKMTTGSAGTFTFDSLEYIYTAYKMQNIVLSYTTADDAPDPDESTLIRLTDKDGTVLQDWKKMDAGTYPMAIGTRVEVKNTTSGLYAYQDYSFTVTGNGTLNCHMYKEWAPPLPIRTRFDATYTPDGTISGDQRDSRDFIVVPTSTYGVFRYNNTTSPTAPVTLSANNCEVTGLDFENSNTVRLSGRVLYENSSIPAAGTMFLLSGDTVRRGNKPLTTSVDGNFEMVITKGQPYTLQAIKPGHTFVNDGYLEVETGKRQFALNKNLDGTRLWDKTKVSVKGRVVGGTRQAAKPLGFGLSNNNLGDSVRLVLELEGDNVSRFVRIPDDLTKDTLEFTIPHTVLNLKDSTVDTVGMTKLHYQTKRIIVEVDKKTGEFSAELFPVRYKIVQATAQGYATLFASGKTSETIDLTDAATSDASVINDNTKSSANVLYSLIYRSPIDLSCTQVRYGLAEEYLGEKSIQRQNLKGEIATIPLATKQANGEWNYLFGYPVFASQEYTFRITAHEDYYYNNDVTRAHEEVRIKGGYLKIYNGLHSSRSTLTKVLDDNGETQITIPVDNPSFVMTGTDALRSLDLSVESDGAYIEKKAITAYIMGERVKGRDYTTSTHGKTVLLDILRDPPGANSSAYLEKGTTYTYSYENTYDLNVGANINIGTGSGMALFTGIVSSVPGAMTGVMSSVNSSQALSIPITFNYHMDRISSFGFTTNERIETSNDAYHVGEDADVYIGATQNMAFDIVDAIKPMDSTTYAILGPRDETGTLRKVAEGKDANGKTYYLALSNEVAIGSYINSTFHFTHQHIRDVLLPQLAQQRAALLLHCDSITAQAKANVEKKAQYITSIAASDTSFGKKGTYQQINPNDSISKKKVWPNEVEAYTKQISDWIDILVQNESEKVEALYAYQGEEVGSWSVSDGTTASHSDSYTLAHTAKDYYKFPGIDLDWNGVSKYFSKLGTSAMEAVKKLSQVGNAPRDTMQVLAGGTAITIGIKPVLDMTWDKLPTEGKEYSRKTGFTLSPGEFGYMDVSVYRVVDTANVYYKQQDTIGSDVVSKHNHYTTDMYRYGSYVYRLNGGASHCPWEKPDSTHFYTPQLALSAGTINLENQKIDLDVHELSDVPHDKPAVFNLKISCEGAGNSTGIFVFWFKVKDGANPKGAKIFIDGTPLSGQTQTIYMTQGQVINRTMEVYAGEDYDYEDIVLQLGSNCNIMDVASTSFTVHYMPVACPVNIATPHDKWILNTLSPKDERGYYMPVSIDGFNIHYKEFDHIELQYKLSSRPDDDWTNQCSYYADSALYEQASGNKAMISGGKIDNIRFYGERDPMEQEYDLRAVAFCRHGSGFITRSSAVMRGVKDTRPPRVFGSPQPANAILGVGDDLKLRFNEAIAGNYLDEDNNFQLLGVTNATGITTGTSLHFDGTQDSYAGTKVGRTLSQRSVSIDLLVKPTDPYRDEVFFSHEENGGNVVFGKTADNRLYAEINGKRTVSKQLEDPMLDFTRVIVTYDITTKKILFYAGTSDVTNSTNDPYNLEDYKTNAPLVFGRGFDGNMLEARIWTKVLTPEEIALTHLKRLTGYERELAAYYPMNEGKGETVTDKANGATLYTHGATWTHRNGISIALTDSQRVQLNSNVLSRSDKQDFTLMFWYNAQTHGALFTSDKLQIKSNALFATMNNWHHVVLAVNRTMNTASIFVDGEMIDQLSADSIPSLGGAMYLGGEGFVGNIDEFVLFEQALPKSLIDEYGSIAPVGDEMGIMAYLPFEQLKENTSGVMELIFSPNDQRVFTDADGKVVKKVVPLITTPQAEAFADKANYAPLSDHGQLTKLKFDWTFNNDELLVNINMADREINKQSMYITVRDVEDLHGNPMVSPVSWTAFVDRNALKWEQRQIQLTTNDQEATAQYVDVNILNGSGKRHQYTVESLPDWLTVNRPSGSMDPTEVKTLRLTFSTDIAIGVYSDIVYLTDENGLSEPLRVAYTIEAECPYTEPDMNKYPLNMSICGEVILSTKDGGMVYDTDSEDKVIVLYRNTCVGMTNIDFDATRYTSKVHLFIHGNESMNGKALSFLLWQASTGKVLPLAVEPDSVATFKHGAVYGCGNEQIVRFTVGSSETQNIELEKGWNWISFNVDLNAANSLIMNVMTAADPWSEGDIIKNPTSQEFVTYSNKKDEFVGTFNTFDYHRMYMVYTKAGNTMRVNGDKLKESNRTVTLYGGNQWSELPALLDQTTSVTEALANYYNKATPGDIVKSHGHFAYFSADGKWEGDLKSLRPGEGYLFRRLGQGDVTIHFYSQKNNAPKQMPAFQGPGSTTMTMICEVEGEGLRAYIGNELVGVATRIDSLYYLTISSDAVGEIRFETEDGTPLRSEMPITYLPNAHHGSLNAPITLTPGDNRPYKIIENNHVIIIRNNEKYDVTGKKL